MTKALKTPHVNSTRLKDKLLAEIPEIEAHKKGRDIFLAFKKDMLSLPKLPRSCEDT
jgi:hypothetical protein